MKIKIYFLLFLVIYSINANAYDEYDGEILRIKAVKLENTIYTNVLVTILKVISIDSGFNLNNVDVYDTSKNMLFIPQVKYNNTLYNNVRVTIGKVIAVGDVIIDKSYDAINIYGVNNLTLSPTSTPSYYSFYGSYWRLEYDGSEKGSCEVIAVGYNRINSAGLCLNILKIFDDFILQGPISEIENLPNMKSVVLQSLNNGPIFRGILNIDGTGSGTWEKFNTNSKGTWTARRFSDSGVKFNTSQFPNVNLSNPMPDSLAADKKMFGYWSRPAQSNFPERAIFLPDGKYAWVNLPCSGTYGSCPIGVSFGTFNLINDNWDISPQSTLYSPLTTYSNMENIKASGYYIPNNRVVGIMKSSYSQEALISFDKYDESNSLAITLKDLKGIYYSNNYSNTIIQEDGTFSGTIADGGSGCKFVGSLKPVDLTKKYNLFQVTLKYFSKLPNSSCINGTEYSGYVTLIINGAETYLNSITMPINGSMGKYNAFSPNALNGTKIQ